MTPPKPTDAELDVLSVLWEHGPSTVREVHEALGDDTAYTTTLKIMQRMVDKGLLDRDAGQRSHVYRPSEPAESTRGNLVADLVERAFAGSAAQLAMRALSSQRATPDELDALRALLDDLEGR